MFRMATAAIALAVIVGCDGEGINRITTTENGENNGIVRGDGGQAGDNNAGDSVNVANQENNGSGDANGSGTNAGNTGIGSNSDNTGTGTSPSDCTISADAGSSSSDGGISADAGSSSSDGGISADAGSSSSDCGITAGAGNSNSSSSSVNTNAGDSSDGGIIADDGGNSSASTDNNTQDTNAGSFESDNSGGGVIRQSSLSSGGSQNLCSVPADRNDFASTTVGDFILHNNAWRPWRVFPDYAWEQCIYTNTNGALAGWNYDWGPGRSDISGNRPSGDYYVRSYPELIYGVKDEFRTSAPQSVTGLPVKLSEIPNIRIDYSFDGPQYGESRTVDASNNPRFPNGSTISGERNVAIESFFYNADASSNCSEGIVTRNGGSNHTYEVMVWLDAGAERLPAGPSDFVADLTVRGAPYKVYTKGADPRYIAFVAQNPQTSGTVYWNDFIDWARDNAHVVRERFGARSNSVQIEDNWCMANILVGTEIFWGAGNFDIYDWTITQSR